MGFKGYWFNNIKQKHITYKYPHCYVGVKHRIAEGAFWGSINEKGIPAFWGSINEKGIPAFWGSYGGDDMAEVQHSLLLNEDNFVYDRTPGWRMAVEKEWHVLDPVSLDGAVQPMYDVEYNELPFNNIGIRIFYKMVVPLYLCANNGLDIDTTKNYVFDNMIGPNNYEVTSAFNNCPLGVAGFPEDKIGKPTRILSVDTKYAKGAYALPDDSILNATNLAKTDFATSINMVNTLYLYGGPSKNGKSTYTISSYLGNNFLMLNNNTTSITSGTDVRTLNYTFRTGPTNMNIPNTIETPEYNSYIPSLFKPFGLVSQKKGYYIYTSINNTTKKINDTALKEAYQFLWFYCVLGVKDMSKI